ncbi:MAG: glycosyltransferase family 2 protein [candidate division Zixibacteria bacterium]|nr:glycosyltransferase family 2 protein [candidate division Zixibacteria bacterium]MDH3938547.1 glycosyltransferase family 2 protein [candidate division Zixibacteria bacterium]MDH4034813.1 glycosyltransferase family 2 protein [candidate division Zixibacteria bacterium]
MKLSIIIPVYNEVSTLEELIKRVKAAPVDNKEIILVDDYSTDGTRDLIRDKLSGMVDQVHFQDRNYGKGFALKAGFALATGDIVLVQDADLEYDPDQYPLLIEPIAQDRADVVYGSRFQGGGPHRVVYFWHSVGNQLLTLLSNMFTNINLTDMETCYKVFRREIIQSIDIQEPRFGVEPEITAKIAKKRVRIYEIGISYYGRTYDEGKKIGWRDGVHAIWCILKYNLWAR